ncbi:beta-galactosidase [Sphingomonas montana]|uniref:beta-galactosidase n=1 Tax=Sphingomonas montana TaxID=1843236 RepID=UPI001F0A4E5E|nr:beta-galactosidase [Sphingomonas montana]
MRITLLATCALLLGAPAAAAPSAPAAAHQVQSDKLWFGSAWYPEQWPEERWPRDLALMKAQGANVVRIGEFAWSRMEPAEGQYDLDWLVRAVRLAARYDIKVVIGTPTDTPPAWLTTRYPDTLRVDSDGKPAIHGGRRQFSISSPRYRDLSRRVVAAMAAKLGREPNVVGWQIGNEYTDESYDPAARAAWHRWLAAKYKTLDALNDAWTTSYWSQTYSAWDQVPYSSVAGNPGWMIDQKRFITDTWVDFQKVQVDALRAGVAPHMFITTNLGGLGWANRFDRYAINRDLDLASWDNYVGTGHLEPYRNGATHDLARGWKRRNFWVMEAQPGFVNWAGVSNMLDRGESRAMAWHMVGHGADALLYWQWRSAPNGQEQYHGALVGADGEPIPFYTEAQEIGRDFAKASAALAGTEPVSQVAILQDYDSRWAIDFQLHNREYDQIKVLLDTYRPLKDRLGAVDIVSAAGPLDRYRLVFAPSLNMIPAALGRHLAAYVRAGGHLVLGPRSGMKDEYNRLDPHRQPGPLTEMLGGRVEQFYALDETVPVGGGTASIWAEQLATRAPDATVPLRYGKANGWIDGQPAAVSRPYGKGRITYLGALLDPASMDRFVAARMAEAAVTPDFAVPAGVERMIRTGKGRTVTILVNHGRTPQPVTLPMAMRDVLNGGSVSALTLPARGVAVLDR